MDLIRVLIAEDHAMIREGLKQLLELEKDSRWWPPCRTGSRL